MTLIDFFFYTIILIVGSMYMYIAGYMNGVDVIRKEAIENNCARLTTLCDGSALKFEWVSRRPSRPPP